MARGEGASDKERRLECLARWIVFVRCGGDGAVVSSYLDGLFRRLGPDGRRLPPPPIANIPDLRERCRAAYLSRQPPPPRFK